MEIHHLLRTAVAIVLVDAGAAEARAAVVAFSQPDRVVVVNETVDVGILITYDAGESGELFSYGVRLAVAGPAASILTAIDVPSELEFFGADGAPAFRDLDPAVMGVKGTVDALAPSTPPYDGSLLAVYRMRFPAEGRYDLSLSPFNTLGPSEEIFVAGDGAVLDGALAFGTARIDVIPEPAAAGLLALGTMATVLAAGRRRRRD